MMDEPNQSASSAPRRHPNSIVQLRGKRGWSIKQLAAASRLDEGTLRSLETGRTKLHSGHTQRLSITFGVTTEELLAPCTSRRSPQLSRGRAEANLAAGRGRTRWAGSLPIPEHAHPLVQQMFKLMNQRRTMITDLARASGVARQTISDWRYRRSPNLANFDAVLGALGCEMAIVRRFIDDSDEEDEGEE